METVDLRDEIEVGTIGNLQMLCNSMRLPVEVIKVTRKTVVVRRMKVQDWQPEQYGEQVGTPVSDPNGEVQRFTLSRSDAELGGCKGNRHFAHSGSFYISFGQEVNAIFDRTI